MRTEKNSGTSLTFQINHHAPGEPATATMVRSSVHIEPTVVRERQPMSVELWNVYLVYHKYFNTLIKDLETKNISLEAMVKLKEPINRDAASYAEMLNRQRDNSTLDAKTAILEMMHNASSEAGMLLTVETVLFGDCHFTRLDVRNLAVQARW